MEVTFKGDVLVVEQEKGDPTFSGDRNAAGESRLLYHVKRILNGRGFDLIKKRMHKDGHMVPEMQQYLRARRPSGDPEKDVAIWNPGWMISGADKVLRQEGRVAFRVEREIFA